MTPWVFHGADAQFASAVFSRRELAEEWIKKHQLSGVLTLYPLDIGVYEWCVARGTYDGTRPVTARLVGAFSSAYQEHFHYTAGVRDDSGE